MKQILTVKLASNGIEVLAKDYQGQPSAVTYANRTQAQAAVERLGASEWCIYQSGRPFFVARASQFCPTQSPWGYCHTREQIASGIWTVSTASHGGFHLGPERADAFAKAFPTFDGYAGLPWLEEDCDCCAAIVLWPAEFKPEAVFHAVRMIVNYRQSVAPLDKDDYFGAVRRWLESPDGETSRKIAADYEATRVGLWERGGSGTSGNGWQVYVARGNERRTLHMAEYPTSNWFTDAEVEAFSREPVQINRVEVIREAVMFNENDYGGAFDGRQVISDADPGL